MPSRWVHHKRRGIRPPTSPRCRTSPPQKLREKTKQILQKLCSQAKQDDTPAQAQAKQDDALTQTHNITNKRQDQAKRGQRERLTSLSLQRSSLRNERDSSLFPLNKKQKRQWEERSAGLVQNWEQWGGTPQANIPVDPHKNQDGSPER